MNILRAINFLFRGDKVIGKLIRQYLTKFIKTIYSNLNDILILTGISFFIFTMFKFVSIFAGHLSVSIVFMILGLLLSKVKANK